MEMTITQLQALELITLLTLQDGNIYGIQEISLEEGECYIPNWNNYIVDIHYKRGEEPTVTTKYKIKKRGDLISSYLVYT